MASEFSDTEQIPLGTCRRIVRYFLNVLEEYFISCSLIALDGTPRFVIH